MPLYSGPVKMLVTPPCGASSNIALWRAYSKPPVELVVAELRRYNLSEKSARKAVQESFLLEALQNEPVETMHDSINSSADDVYDEVFGNF